VPLGGDRTEESMSLTRIDIERRCERCRDRRADVDVVLNVYPRSPHQDSPSRLSLSVCGDCVQELYRLTCQPQREKSSA
jgi:hypothetical protein